MSTYEALVLSNAEFSPLTHLRVNAFKLEFDLKIRLQQEAKGHVSVGFDSSDIQRMLDQVNAEIALEIAKPK
jgi:hypothetical protein